MPDPEVQPKMNRQLTPQKLSSLLNIKRTKRLEGISTW